MLNCSELVIYVLLMISVYGSVVQPTKFCPSTKFCTCSKTMGGVASCRGAMLKFIPVLPSYITILDFSRNRLESINASTFSNLKQLKLVQLYLVSNDIQHITPNAFSSLSFLQRLDLSKNPKLSPSMVADAVAQINSSDFNQIKLDRLKWNTEPTELYTALSRFNISKLVLLDNNFINLNLTFLSENLPHIVEIRIAYGILSSIQPGFFKRLEKLNLYFNQLRLTRDFFGNGTTCYFPRLVNLNIRANVIYDISNLFWCLEKVEFLRISGNPIQRILNNTLNQLPSLRVLYMNDLGFRFNRIEDSAFQSISLRRLHLSNNNFRFKDDVYYHFNKSEMFRYSPKIDFLDLSGNTFYYIDVLQDMLSPLKSLRYLHMQNCKLHTLPENLFFKLHNLISVDMANNRISTWNGYKVFGNLSNIQTLDLTGNIISDINEKLFPINVLTRISTLSLGNNPFSCTCSNIWFHNRIKNEKRIFQGYPESYHCKTPPGKDGELLENAMPTFFECQNNEIFFAVVTSLSLSGIAFVIVSSLIFRLRWHIRYWVYLYRVKKKGFSLITNEATNFEFEAYVIYCEKDVHWIRYKLLENIEKESGIPLCIKDRDFEVGNALVDNIVENMSASRRIILIISRDMVKNSWCLFETRIAQEKFLNRESDALIVIMLEDVSEENMSSSLRAFVNSSPVCKFPTKEYEEGPFWLELTKLLREQR
ncbi:toll-like receptor 3 [Mytilus edulis]|uniref:toll-like receptor 3 n=1 Tax=Mytilus edulis TaxID=6550 RepID=UPI0039EFA4DB